MCVIWGGGVSRREREKEIYTTLVVNYFVARAELDGGGGVAIYFRRLFSLTHYPLSSRDFVLPRDFLFLLFSLDRRCEKVEISSSLTWKAYF